MLALATLAVVSAGCTAATAPNPVTTTVTAVSTVVSTVVSTTVSTVLSTVTSLVTRTEETTVTATPIMDIPGPDGGPACPGDPRYVDEPTTGLDARAAAAWDAAKAAAAGDGVTLCLNDGKRSRAQQQALYDDYVRQYGTTAADELVLTPDKSSHVTGLAVDAQPAAGYRWLEATGGSYGWCRSYDNEPWHFEFRADYAANGCPARLAAPQR